MPNYVTNIIKISEIRSEEEIDDIIAKITNDEGKFDFEKIIPMPENIYRGNLGKEEIEKYGENNWYDWSLNNWGTKWNAIDSHIIKGKKTIKIFFDTAWSTPIPIEQKIIDMFGKYEIEIRYADEDLGHNCGIIIHSSKEQKVYRIDKEGSIDFAKRVVNRCWIE